MKSFIIEWNNQFPLDRWFRKKYNLPFNCEKHRKSNQIDIYFEYLEDKLFDQYVGELEENEEKERLYKNGEWLSNRYHTTVSSKELESFENIPLDAFNNMTISDE